MQLAGAHIRGRVAMNVQRDRERSERGLMLVFPEGQGCESTEIIRLNLPHFESILAVF